jgi:RNA polymerase sigma-70 factor (ECF subfamily)
LSCRPSAPSNTFFGIKTVINENTTILFCDFFLFLAFNRSMMQHPFLTLVEEHSAAINRVCRSFCHTAEDCEDLRQDIIVNLWLGWSRYRPTAKPVTWVWRVAVNTGISWRRHRQRQVETAPIEGLELPDEGIDREEREWLCELIRQLPTKDQKLLRLYLDGWKQDEIGEMLGISETNVQTRMSRIKEKLRKLKDGMIA